MLEDVAAYLTLAPLAASLALGAVVCAVWLVRRRPAPARVRVRVRHRR
ncbi:MAG TPA: hypothetical protein VLW53_15040 [Candidatus Eisenbacteria bacterium]|nr:hypothetical protein [Candidatus Eisenbacteria bacterium]